MRGPIGAYRVRWSVDGEPALGPSHLWIGTPGGQDLAYVPAEETAAGEVWSASVVHMQAVPPRWSEPTVAAVQVVASDNAPSADEDASDGGER